MPVLAIMAAGQSSRYKKSKQLDNLINNYSLIDFSIYDALSSGFKKIILIINHKQKIAFLQKYQNLIEKKILKLVIQQIEDIPKGLTINVDRTKPWGTAHCVYCLKNLIHSPFAIINCDDFYGRASFEKIAKALQKNNPKNVFHLVGFELAKTLSEKGAVSRAVCVLKNKQLQKIQEESQIVSLDNKITNEQKIFNNKTITSMNLWGFTPYLFEIVTSHFKQFLQTNNLNNEIEFYLPQVINQALEDKKIKVKILKTSTKWFGLTHLEDREKTVAKLKELIDNKVYPNILF